jgi:AcrR family transcriptional regulator
MKGMSTGYEGSGRTRQKQRTRDRLLEAARRLIERGGAPSVDDVAEAAGISRATAYRYFGSYAQLLAAAFPETTAPSLLEVADPEDVRERVTAVATTIIDRVERLERHQRVMLRLSLEDVPHETPLRQGRAIAWFSEALEPLHDELGDAGLHHMALALRSVCGIETRVWLHDIAGLESAPIRELQLWMVNALLAHAKHHPPPHNVSPHKRPRP